MAISKQLAQARAPITTPAQLYTRVNEGKTTITDIFITNTSNSQPFWVSLFHDDDGTTYDGDTALIFRSDIPAAEGANSFVHIQCNIHVSRGGTIGIVAESNNAVAFTLYGVE